MRNFTSIHDVPSLPALLEEAARQKKNPFGDQQFGKNKTLGLVFFNASLRTRMSTQVAAENLGMRVMVLNVKQDSWGLEMQDGAIMNGDKAEHVREAAAVMGQYCDILGIRSFPSLTDRDKDYSEEVLTQFKKYAGRPILSLESATRHPLQSLADLLTIEEYKPRPRPKVVLTWAPHVRALPQAVPNSFAEWMNAADVEFVITHPPGYELATPFVGNARVTYDRAEAFEHADFIYVKNWSSYHQYGEILTQDPAWMLTLKALENTRQARVMHCLPVRRNVVIADEVLDSEQSIVIAEAGNRVWAAQAVLKQLLTGQQDKPIFFA